MVLIPMTHLVFLCTCRMLLVGRIWAGLGNGLVTVSIGAMFNVETKIAKTCVLSTIMY